MTVHLAVTLALSGTKLAGDDAGVQLGISEIFG